MVDSSLNTPMTMRQRLKTDVFRFTGNFSHSHNLGHLQSFKDALLMILIKYGSSSFLVKTETIAVL